MNTGKQILAVLICIAVVYFGVDYFYSGASKTDAQDCSGEFRKELPLCMTQDRSGSHSTVINDCDFDVTVRWDFFAGEPRVQVLSPGERQRVSTFPVKIDSVWCCSKHTWCF